MENLNRRKQAFDRNKIWRPDLLKDNKEKEQKEGKMQNLNRCEFLALTACDALSAKLAKKQLKHSQCQNIPSTSVALRGAKV